MDVWIAKNKNAGKEIIGSKYFDGGPFFQKEYNIWFREPYVEDVYHNNKEKRLTEADLRVDEKTLKQLFSFSKETRLKCAQLHDEYEPKKFKLQVIC